MVSKRLSIYGFVSAAAVVTAALVGCGGSSASVQGLSPIVTTTGGVSSAGGTSATPVNASTSPQQVQVLSGGTTVTGTLPPGESIPANGAVGVISNGTPIINGLTLSTSAVIKKVTPATTGGQGQVYVDGVFSGLTVTSGGALSNYLILTPGKHTVTAYGPFAIVGGTAFAVQTLIVGTFSFGVVVLPDGTPSVPSALTLNLPADGGALSKNYVTAGYSSEFAGYTGTLSIVYGGTTVTKGQALVLNSSTGNATATYNALSAHAAIPTTGVDSVSFNVTP